MVGDTAVDFCLRKLSGPMSQSPLGPFLCDGAKLLNVSQRGFGHLQNATFWGDDAEKAPTNLGLTFPSLGIMLQLLKSTEEPPTPKPKIELPERFRVRPVTPAEKYIKVRKVVLNSCFPK